MGAWWLLVRTDLRRRWPAVGALALLIGLAGTFVLTAATGARRADTVLDRFLDATEMWDGSIEVDFPATDDVVADVAKRPEVEAASAVAFIPLTSAEGEVDGVLAGLAPGWLRDVYRPRIVAGRLPDPARDDELLVNEAIADEHHLAVGDKVVLEDYIGAGITHSMTIVGVHRAVIDLTLADTYPGTLATEAFGRRFGGEMYAVVAGTPLADQIRPHVVARTRGDGVDPHRLLDEVAEGHADARPLVADQSRFVSPLERALGVQVEAFWILTAISAASALLLLGMAVARLAATATHPARTLSAVGFDSRSRARVTIAIPALTVVAGCGLALAGAMLASPLVPLGSARLVEPDPGIWVDPATLLVGGVVLAAGLALVAAAVARLDRLHRRARRSSRPMPQLPLPVTLGRDLAYRESTWGGLALVATAVGLGLIVSVLVYDASLDRLIASPSLFGSDFETVLFPTDEAGPDDVFADVDLDDPAIEAVAIASGAQVKIAGDLLESQVIDPVRGVAGGTLLRGRAPSAGDEVALGPTTADRLGLGVGDEVTIGGARSRSMRIVGEAVLPAPGQGAYGDVLWLAPAAAGRLGLELQEPRLMIHFTEGATPDEVSRVIGDHPDNSVIVPDDVSNLDDVGQIPRALAAFGVVLSGAVLTFAMVGIVRRRRLDLAIVRTLGLRPRDIRRSVLAASLLIVGPGVAIGVATGAALGRTYWSSVVAGVPALSRPVLPLAAIALIVIGAIVTGCILVAVPARMATRIRPGEILQRD